MNKVIEESQVKELPNNAVLVGGCFDVLHPAHTEFLKKARQEGDSLCILLESDEHISKLKGNNRPVNNQSARAENLSKIEYVDHIILLNMPDSSQYYYNLVKLLQPAIIAVTAGDPLLKNKKEQAEMVGGRVIEVMKRNPHYSSTKLIENKV